MSGSIATDEKESKAATQIGEKEAADFAVSQEELMADVDTLYRAIGVLDKELNKGCANAFASIDTSNTKAVCLHIKGLEMDVKRKSKVSCVGNLVVEMENVNGRRSG